METSWRATRWLGSTPRRPRANAASRVAAGLQDHDGAEHLAALHLVERGLDVLERDRLGHEAVQVESTLQVQVDQHREVARRQAVAVPARLELPATAEQLDERQLDRHVGPRHADQDDSAGEIARLERLAVD